MSDRDWVAEMTLSATASPLRGASGGGLGTGSSSKGRYDFGRRFKTLSDLTPYEYACKIRTSEPEKFIINLCHETPRLNTVD